MIEWIQERRKNKGDKIRCCGEYEELGELLQCDSVHGAENNMNGCTTLPDFLFKFFHFPFIFLCVFFGLSGPYNNIEFEMYTFHCSF